MSDQTRPYHRLFLSSDEWRDLPKKLEDPHFRRIAEDNREAIRLTRAAEGRDPTDVPEWLGDASTSRHPPGGRPSPERAVKARLLRETVAWRLSGQRDHLDAALRLVDHAIDALPWGGHGALVHAHFADLHTGDVLYIAAFALDALGPELGDERRARLIDRTREALGNYLTGLRRGEWWRHADFNWNSALHGQAGLAALALEPFDRDLAARVLREARVGLTYLIENIQPGGGWTEGLMYQTTAFAHLTDFVAALHRLTGDGGDDLGLSRNRDLEAALTSRMSMIAPDGKIINFSNCNADTVEWPMAQVYWWARQLDRPDLAWFEDKHVRDWRDLHGVFHDVEAFWFRDAHQNTGPAKVAPLVHLRGLDWFFWRGERTWLGFRSGFNGGNHNNRDLGSFVFGAGTDRFLIDPGYGASQTNQHNAVTLRGQQQTDAAEAKIFRVREMADGDGTPRGFYLCCDLSAAFPHVAAVYNRHLLLVDDRHLLVVDDISSRRGRRNSATFHLQTWASPDLTGKPIVIPGERHDLLVRHLTPIAARGVTSWEHAGRAVHTVSWRNDWDHVHSVSAMLLTVTGHGASGVDAAEARFARDNDRATLAIEDAGAWSIDLAEGSLIVTESEDVLR